MSQGQYFFSQLFCLLYRNYFNYLARKYGGNRYVKHFSCRNHLLSMMFGQLSNCESQRDVVVVLESHHSRCKFLGIGRQPIDKFTLASSNQIRDYSITGISPSTWWSRLVRNGQLIFLIFLWEICNWFDDYSPHASLHFHGSDLEERKAVLKPMSFIILRLIFLPSAL